MTKDDATHTACEAGISVWQQFHSVADERQAATLKLLYDAVQFLRNDRELASDEREQRLRALKRGDAIRHRTGHIGVVEYNAVRFRELLVVFRASEETCGTGEDCLNLCGYDFVTDVVLPA